MKRLNIPHSIRFYCVLLVVLYMCRVIITVFETSLPLYVLRIYYASTILMSLLILLVAIKQPNRIPKDYFFILFIVVVAFKITNIVHPEYKNYISDEFWRGIVSLNGGLFGYFFIRFIRDKDLIEKGLKIVALILFIVFFLQSLGAISRGYWYILYKGNIQISSYNMTFGYNMLIPTLIFLYYGMKERKFFDILVAIIGSLEIIMLGSRAAILGIPAMVFLYIFFCEQDMGKRKKTMLIAFMLVFLVLLAIFFRQILYIFNSVFSSLGFSSRTIQRMIEGSLKEDVARASIYTQTISLIRNNFWGSGMLADRYFFGVYCHNIFLEVMLQLGWIGGTILLFFFIVLTVKILLGEDNNIKGIFLIFFCTSFFRLLVSHSLWINQYFWCAVGVAVTYSKSIKMKGKKITIKFD